MLFGVGPERSVSINGTVIRLRLLKASVRVGGWLERSVGRDAKASRPRAELLLPVEAIAMAKKNAKHGGIGGGISKTRVTHEEL